MKFFIIDESNIKKDEKFEFFVYGGLIVDDSEIRVLSKQLIDIKRSFNIEEKRPIKWPNFNWDNKGQLDPEIHAKIKEAVLVLVNKSSSKIIIYLSPHDFYHTWNIALGFKLKSRMDPEKYLRAQKYAINVCLNKFNLYLSELKENGMVLADSFVEQFNHVLTEHCLSLYPDGKDRKLDKIIYPVVQVNNECSEIHQINDVILGAITFSMREMAQNFMPIIKDNFWGASEDGFSTILNKGINIYPREIKTPQLKEKIGKLKEKFDRLMIL